MRTIGWGVFLSFLATAAFGQRPVPIADSVDQPLVPPGISDLPVHINAELAYLFEVDADTNAVHLIGDFVLTVGEGEGQKLQSREAVLWLGHREFEGRPYVHLQVFLWRDASVDEIGGTFTAGPALFVTLNTFAKITTDADEVAFQSSADMPVFREGDTIRQAIASRKISGLSEDASLSVFDASGLGTTKDPPKPRPVMLFRTEGEVTGPMPHDGHSILTVTGGTYLSRGTPGASTFMDIRADSVVVFLAPSGESEAEEGEGPAGLGPEPRESATGRAEESAQRRREKRESSDRQMMATGFGNVEVEAVYLEGDIVMSQGASVIHASKLYYDFVEERAVILDAVFRTLIEERNVPLYMRAAEIRQLSAKQFSADDAILTTSEFHTPHYHIGAAHVDLTNLTPGGGADGPAGLRAGAFRIRHATLNLGGVPVGYWPFVRGNINTSETSIKSMRTGYSDDFGFELETKWHLFNALGYQTPDGFDATLELDFYSERGPAIGVEVDYQRQRYFGEVKSYLLFDDGEDFLGEDRETPSTQDARGRILVRHRQFLEDDWQLTLELSYISDSSFLEEFFESEFDNDKEQETLLYLKKQRDNWAFTVMLAGRLMDFVTATERMPDLAYFRIGEPVGTAFTWFSENRAGFVRHRVKDQTFRELLRDGRAESSGTVARVDTRQEIDLPIDVGPLRLVPFIVGRGSAWDDSPDEGGLARAFATLGVRGSMYLTKEYPDFQSSLFDINGLRHIIKPSFIAWLSEANTSRDELYPFDNSVEHITDGDGIAFGIRQRWQTKRGGPGHQRTVDVLTVDTEFGFFNDIDGESITNGYISYSRPEESIAHNYLNHSSMWRINDRTAFLSELNYDVNDGQVDIVNLSVAVERSPRFSYILGYRFIDETDSSLLGFDMNYRLTEKHTVAFRELFDLDRGRTLDFTIAFIRKMPRWFAAVSFELDEARDDFGISFSIWPQGLPQAALGSRKFTGLSTSTRLGVD